jgi:hypothetical protein
MGHQPASELEAAALVFFRTARSLHDPVRRQKRSSMPKTSSAKALGFLGDECRSPELYGSFDRVPTAAALATLNVGVS